MATPNSPHRMPQKRTRFAARGQHPLNSGREDRPSPTQGGQPDVTSPMVSSLTINYFRSLISTRVSCEGLLPGER